MHTTAQPGINSADGFNSLALEPNQIPGWWAELQPMIERSMSSYGELTVDDIGAFLVQGRMQAFILTQRGELRFVAVVEIGYFPRMAVARIVAASGSNHLDDALQFWPALEAWATALGASYIEAWCEPPQARLFLQKVKSLRPVYQVLRSFISRTMLQ